MQDEAVAYLVLTSASAADGGCVPCVQGCIDQAIYLAPDLPWELAVARVRPETVREQLSMAVVNARKWLERGNPPRVMNPELADQIIP